LAWTLFRFPIRPDFLLSFLLFHDYLSFVTVLLPACCQQVLTLFPIHCSPSAPSLAGLPAIGCHPAAHSQPSLAGHVTNEVPSPLSLSALLCSPRSAVILLLIACSAHGSASAPGCSPLFSFSLLLSSLLSPQLHLCPCSALCCVC